MAPQFPTAAALRPLLERRLVIVTGKGGTGKTSVAAALALAAASSGKRVLVAEVGRDEHLPRLIAPGSPPVGYAGRELVPQLTAMRIDPYAALGEYLGLQLHLRSAVELVLRNRAFRQLMDASPGWRELITLGKVWHFEQMRDPRGAPRFDLLVVDAPATGHGISFLDVPRVVVSAVRTGPLRRNAELVEEMIADRDRTLLLPVALAEELPARETADLVAKVRGELRIALDRIVVNALVARPFPPGLEDLDVQLARLPAEPRWPGLPPPPVIAACAAHLRSRYELNRVYLDEIARSTGLPVVPLPFLPSGIRGPEDLRRLAEPLLATPVAVAA
ncbi:MAG TPA: ArsA-related P-loop ATPase [Myxococcota bacterium]|nr:ArsA-related P-loop ATPase [Myxococcota bacterium]